MHQEEKHTGSLFCFSAALFCCFFFSVLLPVLTFFFYVLLLCILVVIVALCVTGPGRGEEDGRGWEEWIE